LVKNKNDGTYGIVSDKLEKRSGHRNLGAGGK
jgi:hypothetical protein